MTFRLKNGEKVRDGMRRLVCEQADKALEELTANNGNRDDAIHDARVCFKKVRAILRLMHDQMGDRFQEENGFYRDLGRKLSSVRNNAAMIECLAKLKQRFGAELSAHALSAARRPLVESNARGNREKRRALTAVARRLRGGRRRVAQWPFGGDGFGDLAGGLKRTYRQGRKEFATSCQDPTVENLHEWRKRVKDLWYQLRVLKEVWPEEVGKLADELERLGGYLSDHHDLAQLRESSAENWKEIGDDPEVETLIALIDQRTAELRLEARLLGGAHLCREAECIRKSPATLLACLARESKSQPVAAHASKSS